MELCKTFVSTCYRHQRAVKYVFVLFCFCVFVYMCFEDISPGSALVELVQSKEEVLNINQDECDAILSNTRLSNVNNPWFRSKGCILHNYTKSDAQTCMRRISQRFGVNSICLLGDSKIKRLFMALTGILGRGEWKIPLAQKHDDLQFYKEDIGTVVYFRFRGRMNKDVYNEYMTWVNSPKILRPRIVVQGNALWDLTFGGPFNTSSKDFRGNLSRVRPYMEKLTTTTDILWMIQDPTDERKMDKKHVRLRGRKRIDAFNQMSLQILSNTSVKFWHSARDVAIRFPNDSDAWGIHYGSRVTHYKVQLFLNWYCNPHMIFPARTCCSGHVIRKTAYKKSSLYVAVMSVLLIICLLLVMLTRFCRSSKQTKPCDDKVIVRSSDLVDHVLELETTSVTQADTTVSHPH